MTSILNLAWLIGYDLDKKIFPCLFNRLFLKSKSSRVFIPCYRENKM